MTAMPGPYFVAGGGTSIPPPHLIPLVQYAPGYSHPVTQHQMIPPAPLPHPPGHLIAPQPLSTANQGPIGSQYRTGMNVPPSGFEMARQPSSVQGLTSPVQNHGVIPGTFSAHNPVAAPSLFSNSSKWAATVQDLKPQKLEKPETDEERIQRELYRKFGAVIKENGPVEATNEKILNIFIQLTGLERKVIMAQGSIKAFLSKCSYITVSGNTLEVTGDLPGNKDGFPAESLLEDKEASSNIHSALDSAAVGSGMPDAWLKEHLRQALFRRFGELLREGPLEVTSQKVLNLFLKLTSADRRFIMNYGGISEFLVTCSFIKLQGNYLVLHGEIPSETQITSDMAPGLFSGPTPSNSESPDSIPAFSSESSLFPSSSFLKASSPVFVPKMLENPMTQYLDSIHELRPRGNSAAATLGSLGVTGYDEDKRAVNGRDQSEALPYSSSASPISSNRDISAHSSPLTLSRASNARGGGEQYRDSGGLRDATTQSIIEVVTKAVQTDVEACPNGSSGGIEEKLAKRKLEHALSRAAQAEEKAIDLQAELCKQTLAKIRQEVLDNYIKIVRTPNRSETEKNALQKDYSTVMRLIQEELDRVEILHDSNQSALRDGLELKALPEISFTIPTIPKNLATPPQTTFGSGFSQPSSTMMTSQTDLIEKIQDDVMPVPTIGRLRQASETSSVLSVDSSNIDASKRPPGLDNLQDLKVKGKESLHNGSITMTAEVTNERPQSQSSSEHSSLAAESKISHSTTPDSLPTPGVMPSLPGPMPGIMPQMPMFPGFMNAGMTPEAMQHMMLMMQSMGHPPPGQMMPSSAALPSDNIMQTQSVNAETKSGGTTNVTDSVKTFFPTAHELEFKAMSQQQADSSAGLPESFRSITRGAAKATSSDLNSNIYHWPPSSVQDQKPADQRLSQGSASTTDRWGTVPSNNKFTTPFRPEETWEHNVLQAQNMPQPSGWKSSVDVDVSESMSTLAAEAVVSSSMPGSKKPLPVLQSSISTVSVNVVPPKRYTPAEMFRSDTEPQGAAAPAQLPKAQGQAVQGAKGQKVQGDTEGQKGSIRQKNQDVDATNPLLSSRPSVMPPDGAISGISEINIQDDIGAWETGWEHMLESDIQWQQVSKKSKKGQEEDEAAMSTNFEKLLQKIRDSYPKLTRQDTIQVVNEVRQKRGALKGISIAQILDDAAEIIKGMKVVGKPDVTKGIPKDEPEVANNVLYKTSICSFWQNGKCTKTSRECIYAHGKKDLRPLPKNNMCNNILSKGSCPYGDKCIFAHSKEELKKTH